MQLINQDPPATCSEDITSAVAEAAEKLGLSTKRMVSRAYHDSLFMARCAVGSIVASHSGVM